MRCEMRTGLLCCFQGKGDECGWTTTYSKCDFLQRLGVLKCNLFFVSLLFFENSYSFDVTRLNICSVTSIYCV
jgi:hypothetical protein